MQVRVIGTMRRLQFYIDVTLLAALTAASPTAGQNFAVSAAAPPTTEASMDGSSSELERTLLTREVLAVAPSGTYAVIGEDDQQIRVVRLSDLATYRRLIGHGYVGRQWAAFAGDEERLFTNVWSGSIPSSAGMRGQLRRQPLDGIDPALRRLLLKQMEAYGSQGNNQIIQWDLSTGEAVDRFATDEHTSLVGLAASGDGSELATLAVKYDANNRYDVHLLRIDAATAKLAADISLPALTWAGGYGEPSVYYVGRDRLVVVGSKVLVYSRQTNRLERSIAYKPNPQHSTAACVDGDRLWVAWPEGIDGAKNWQIQLLCVELSTGATVSRLTAPVPELNRWWRGVRDDLWLPHLRLQLGPSGLYLSTRETDAWVAYSVRPKDRRVEPLARNMRIDWQLPDGRLLVGDMIADSRGNVVARMNDKSPGPLLANAAEGVDSPDVPAGELGLPLLATADGRWLLFENSREFIIWDRAAASSAGRLPRPAGAVPVDPSRDDGRQLRSSAAFQPERMEFWLAIPQVTPYSSAEVVAALGDELTDLTGSQTIVVAEALQRAAPDQLQALGMIYGGPNWSFIRWRPTADEVDMQEFAVRSPGLALAAGDDDVICTYTDEARSIVRCVSLLDPQRRSAVLRRDRRYTTSAALGWLTSLTKPSKSLQSTSWDAHYYAMQPKAAFASAGDPLVEALWYDPLSLYGLESFQADLRSDRVTSESLRPNPALLQFDWAVGLAYDPRHDRYARLAPAAKPLESPSQRPSTSILAATQAPYVLELRDRASRELLAAHRIPSGALAMDQPGEGLSPVHDITFSATGTLLCVTQVVAGGSSMVNTIFDLRSGRPVRQIRGPSPLWLPDRDLMAADDSIVEPRTGKHLGNVREASWERDATPPTRQTPAVQPAGDQRGRLLFLGIGVDAYRDPNIPQLNYCKADVDLLEGVLQKEYARSHRRYLSQVLADAQASLTSVEDALANLETVALPDDVAVIMFCGHGVLAQRGLYLLTADASLEGLQGSALNWQTVAESINRLPCKQIIVLLDACHAGAFSDSNLPMQQEFQRRLQRKAGLIFVAASGGAELSQELTSLGHGAFSSAVAEALQGTADPNQDGRTTAIQFFDFVAQRTAELTDNRQHPQMPVAMVLEDDVFISPRTPEPARVDGDASPAAIAP